MSKGFDRKFDEWYWFDKDEAASEAYTFEVRMKRPENMAKSKEEGEGEIEYYIKSDDPPIYVKAPTLEKLRVALNGRMSSWLSVEWLPKLLVLVKYTQNKEHSAIGDVSIEVEVRDFEEGRAARDDKVWWRSRTGSSRSRRSWTTSSRPT